MRPAGGAAQSGADGRAALLFRCLYGQSGGVCAQVLSRFHVGAVFGKFVEMSGAAASISATIVRGLGQRQVMLAIVLACAVLTYGGVSLFVVAFAVYPLANNLFHQPIFPSV
jgi:H+/gluconate symporter-like permease